MLGYTIGLDMTVRGDGDRSRRKSYDTFTPMGPWMVTADEIVDPNKLDVHLEVDGCVRQHTNTSDMLVDVAGIIAYTSTVMRLDPGDVVLDGSAAWCRRGACRRDHGVGDQRDRDDAQPRDALKQEGGDMSNDIGVDDRLDAFYSDLGSVDLQPLWTQTRNLLPRLRSLPRCRGCGKARRCVRSPREPATSSRSSVAVSAVCSPSPTLASPARLATSTLWGAIQALGAHESAPAHRHSASAIRFVLEGSGVWTTVDGDTCHMHPGDLVLTPAWTFHDHTNDGDEPMIWFDGLDLPIIAALDGSFFENHPDLNQPVRGFDLSEQMYGAGGPCLTARRTIHPIRRCSSSGGSTVRRFSTSFRALWRPDGEHRVRRPDLRSPRSRP